MSNRRLPSTGVTGTFAVACALLLAYCAEPASPAGTDETDGVSAIAAYPVDPAFDDYWYQGLAEITTYNLEQPRYGETRNGKAVLIFVTEDFSRSRHVKLDDAAAVEADDKVTVLKLNRTHKFTTGIYPYSMMSSAFTPVSGNRDPRTLKVTASSQEWCGQTFAQLDLGEDGYQVQHHSYLDPDGDQKLTLTHAILEDEIWAKIRIDPSSLPVGSIRVISGTLHQRLSGGPFMVDHAEATVAAAEAGERTYTLDFDRRDRTLAIRFEEAFPHRISGWEESYTQRRGTDTLRVVTRATRDRSMMLDYWNRSSLADEALRTKLNLQ